MFFAGFIFLDLWVSGPNSGVSLVDPTSFTVTEEDSGSVEFCVQIDRVLERDIPLSLSFGGSAGTSHLGKHYCRLI